MKLTRQIKVKLQKTIKPNISNKTENISGVDRVEQFMQRRNVEVSLSYHIIVGDVRRDRSSPMKKNTFIRFITVTHTITSLCPIIPQSVPMIGHLELDIGTLTSHASWAWLIKICPWSQIFLRRLRADLDLIMNEFKQIGLIGFLVMNATGIK